MSNRLDLDQAQNSGGPDLGPICLQRLQADGTSRQLAKDLFSKILILFAHFFSRAESLLAEYEHKMRLETERLLRGDREATGASGRRDMFLPPY